MKETSGSAEVSTRLLSIAELARKSPEMVLTTLAHHIDIDFLREAYKRTRKDGAVGVDKQTAKDYAKNLETNLKELLERFKSGKYKAPPVRRTYIEKSDGKKKRPLGIPTFEDKLLQKAVQMILEAVYEQDFYDCSYGFRPGKSAHGALQAIWEGLTKLGGGWVIDADIKSYFEEIDHKRLRNFLDRRVRDGVIRRTIDKWLKAGVMEDKQVVHRTEGTPQGGVISPLLANIYLHVVLDEWFETVAKPRLKGRAFLIRYADDFVIVVELEGDAKRIMNVLPKRFSKYGLTIHPEKTEMVDFSKPNMKGISNRSGKGKVKAGTFDLLGFTHYWGKSRRGNWIVKRKTAKNRLSRTNRNINEYCKSNRHRPLKEQHQKLSATLIGHYLYFGLTGNAKSLSKLRQETMRIWKKWLSRRSQKGYLTWEKFKKIMEKYPIPQVRMYQSIYRT